MKIKAQAVLEFSLIFVIIIALLSSLFVMWKWSTNNIVRRQKLYNLQREEAGSIAKPGGKIAQDIVEPLKDKDMVYPED
ncbi:MAG: hypothetical protein WC417_02260 [Candidatus Omnitrophota bacterium]